MIAILGLLGLILAPVAAWYWFGLSAGFFVMGTTVTDFAVGFYALRHSLELEGYVVEYRPDTRGHKRWRVGVKRAPQPERAVKWIVPEAGP